MDVIVALVSTLLILIAIYFGYFRHRDKERSNTEPKSIINYRASNPNSNFDIGVKAAHINKPKPNYQYKTVDSVLTNAEINYFRHLQECFPEDVLILSKVRLLDLFQPIDKETAFGAVRKIASKHIDFIVCCSETFKPLLAIELDDSSHRDVSRQKRDHFVNELFSTSGLKLCRVECANSYDHEMTKSLMSEYASMVKQ